MRDSEPPKQENCESFEEVWVLTRSDELFQSVVNAADGFPFRFVREDGMTLESICSFGRSGIILVDLGSAPALVWENLTLGGIIVTGKGGSLLESWEKYLLVKIPSPVPSANLEDFLREKVRSILTRCEWPGGVYSFIQGIVENVLISEALRLTEGNRQKAARLLGISRTTLRNRMLEKISEDEGSANAESRSP
ncbi:MAG: helix-turn-helix domain-containing protein [Leptospirales bacterium]